MIAADTNVLVCTHRTETELHHAAAARLADLAEGAACDAPCSAPQPAVWLELGGRTAEDGARTELGIETPEAGLAPASACQVGRSRAGGDATIRCMAHMSDQVPTPARSRSHAKLHAR